MSLIQKKRVQQQTSSTSNIYFKKEVYYTSQISWTGITNRVFQGNTQHSAAAVEKAFLRWGPNRDIRFNLATIIQFASFLPLFYFVNNAPYFSACYVIRAPSSSASSRLQSPFLKRCSAKQKIFVGTSDGVRHRIGRGPNLNLQTRCCRGGLSLKPDLAHYQIIA